MNTVTHMVQRRDAWEALPAVPTAQPRLKHTDTWSPRSAPAFHRDTQTREASSSFSVYLLAGPAAWRVEQPRPLGDEGTQQPPSQGLSSPTRRPLRSR